MSMVRGVKDLRGTSLRSRRAKEDASNSLGDRLRDARG